MATPTEIRSIENRILDALAELVTDLISSVQGNERTGKIMMTNGAVAVTGIDTTFTGLAEGDYIAFKADERGYPAFGLIDLIVNDTSLNLATNYNGPTPLQRLNYVTFTKDEYLHAIEYPSVVDLRMFDPSREHEAPTPVCDWWWADEEITDHAENATGTVALSLITHRTNFRLMQQESLEIIHDIEKWFHVHHSFEGLWDYIQYAGFEGSTVFEKPKQQDPFLVMTYYFNILFNRPAY